MTARRGGREEFGASSFHFRSTAFRFKLNPTPISIYSDCRAVTIGPRPASCGQGPESAFWPSARATKLLRDRQLRERLTGSETTANRRSLSPRPIGHKSARTPLAGKKHGQYTRMTPSKVGSNGRRELPAKPGELTLDYFHRRDLVVEFKADASPVTAADRAAEELLRQRIAERFPDDSILGEEFGAAVGTSGYQWVLDPIDGTKSFVHGVPLYTTLVAVLADDQPKVGIIYAPACREMVFAPVGRRLLVLRYQSGGHRPHAGAGLERAAVAGVAAANDRDRLLRHGSRERTPPKFTSSCSGPRGFRGLGATAMAT